MARILSGKEVAAGINDRTAEKAEELKKQGICPTLAILRVGERADDISYEKGAVKRCDSVGVAVKKTVLPETVTQEALMEELDKLNRDDQIHGILVFRPLPKHLDEEAVRQAVNPAKDVDGITDASLAGVFTNTELGFCPCTARAAVVGRSLVVGRPAAMLLLHKNATPTVCHTGTADTASVTREADIVIVCTGRMESMDASFFRPGQTVIDVGIGYNEEKKKLCGDVDFDSVEPVVEAITPVPGGVGAVTTSVLVSHVAEAAARQQDRG